MEQFTSARPRSLIFRLFVSSTFSDMKREREILQAKVFPVLRFWDTGFALDSENAPHLRGLIDIYDGSNHLYQCLVVASEEANGEMVYDFKRSTAVKDKAALDFVRDVNAPVALLGR